MQEQSWPSKFCGSHKKKSTYSQQVSNWLHVAVKLLSTYVMKHTASICDKTGDYFIFLGISRYEKNSNNEQSPLLT